ncbi:aldehyde dehydrogenase family protein [Candidatus Amarobacter glycogenicus]|uniref:aldehyde dehydrogenase family protein n=1 Tax=Candidatus Amarobacter glycogenicus TaxID=3140699 RepID=UPI0031CC4FA1
MEKLLALTKEIHVGDPTQKENWMGPVANKGAFEDYKKFVADLRQDGEIVFGGEVLAGNGYFAAPTIVDNLPHGHYLWKQEMFLPIVTVHAFTDLDDAMAKANDVEIWPDGRFLQRR